MMTDTISPDILQGWKILVIDDEFDSLNVAQLVIGHYGAEVLTAINGKEGLALAKEHKGDLKFILSDLSMPVMDGWEFLYEIKSDAHTAEIPVIALTAHTMQGDRERALSAGFHNYLTKPFTPKKLIRDLVNLLVDIPELSSLLNN